MTMPAQDETMRAERQSLSLNRVRLDVGIQSRTCIDHDTVDEYAEALAGGAAFPPLTVLFDGHCYWVVDGFHRYHAYRKAGRTEIECEVRRGERRDAVVEACGVNSWHGLRRNWEDKRRVVRRLLDDPDWVKCSDREIARRCAVSHTFVSNVRSLLGNVASDSACITKYGTVATMDVSGIRQPLRAEPQAGNVASENARAAGAAAPIQAAPAPAPEKQYESWKELRPVDPERPARPRELHAFTLDGVRRVVRGDVRGDARVAAVRDEGSLRFYVRTAPHLFEPLDNEQPDPAEAEPGNVASPDYEQPTTSGWSCEGYTPQAGNVAIEKARAAWAAAPIPAATAPAQAPAPAPASEKQYEPWKELLPADPRWPHYRRLSAFTLDGVRRVLKKDEIVSANTDEAGLRLLPKHWLEPLDDEQPGPVEAEPIQAAPEPEYEPWKEVFPANPEPTDLPRRLHAFTLDGVRRVVRRNSFVPASASEEVLRQVAEYRLVPLGDPQPGPIEAGPIQAAPAPAGHAPVTPEVSPPAWVNPAPILMAIHALAGAPPARTIAASLLDRDVDPPVEEMETACRTLSAIAFLCRDGGAAMAAA